MSASKDDEQRVHATCVAIAGRGVLLRGPSGAGKSDLALRLITQPLVMPALGSAVAALPVATMLVADDQVVLHARAGRLLARAPALLAGKLEIRGIGIVEVPYLKESFVDLVVDLVAADRIERLPPDGEKTTLLEISLPCLPLAPFQASATAKVLLALARRPPI